MLPLAYINIYVSNENEYKTKKPGTTSKLMTTLKCFQI